MASSGVDRTWAGLVMRRDREFGLLVFSPYTGLIHAVAPSDADRVVGWLQTPGAAAPSEMYEKALGAGWCVPVEEAVHHDVRLLSDDAPWMTLPVARRPMVINWLITGRCPLDCTYCYAGDLMGERIQEPDAAGIAAAANAILGMSPLVVVITGGDPLVSPHLESAIEILSGRVGLMVDTCGYTLRKSHMELFKEHQVTVRVSMDAERPALNGLQRPVRRRDAQGNAAGESSAAAAVKAICMCLESGLTVSVQSVATARTANELPSLGDKLFRLGVKGWRVMIVARCSSNDKRFSKLLSTHTEAGKPVQGIRGSGPYNFILPELIAAAAGRWEGNIALQTTSNRTVNAVVLVGPDGVFYTESNVGRGKVILDSERPCRPRLASIAGKVDMGAHAMRYLASHH